jgi:hypothetical protein
MRKYWNTASNGAFETSGNWTPAGAPGADDLARIFADKLLRHPVGAPFGSGRR